MCLYGGGIGRLRATLASYETCDLDGIASCLDNIKGIVSRQGRPAVLMLGRSCHARRAISRRVGAKRQDCVSPSVFVMYSKERNGELAVEGASQCRTSTANTQSVTNDVYFFFSPASRASSSSSIVRQSSSRHMAARHSTWPRVVSSGTKQGNLSWKRCLGPSWVHCRACWRFGQVELDWATCARSLAITLAPTTKKNVRHGHQHVAQSWWAIRFSRQINDA